MAVDFRSGLDALLAQIPRGRVARCGDIARALGDVRASAAVFRYLKDHPDVPGGHRVVTKHGRAVSALALQEIRSEGGFARGADFQTVLQGSAPLTELREDQSRIAARVSRRNGFGALRTVGGVDVAYSADRGFAALVVLRARDLTVVEEVLASRDVDFPYIPTYLGYREYPLIEAAFRRLREPPTVLLVDGHGEMHPARCGIACMVGVNLGLPTIGVAKSPLVGVPDRRPKVGEAVGVRDKARLLGYALRTSASIRPLFVSTGHRVAPRAAVGIVRRLCRTRLPEPLRIADARAAEWKRRKEKGGRGF